MLQPGSTVIFRSHEKTGIMKKTLLWFAAASLFAADYATEGKLWWAHIQFLADDKLEGRNTGSEGYRKAVAYVAGQFDRLGLQPAGTSSGTSSYEQPVKFVTRTLVADQSSLALVRDGAAEPLTPGQDATASGRGEAADQVSAPMVFVGYGLVIPEANHNDLAGLDLHGKIVVYVNAPGPVQASANVKSHYSSAVERWTALRAAGAIGVATIANPRVPAPGTGQDSAAGGGRGGGAAAAQPTVSLADPALREMAGMQVSVAINRNGGEKFFAGSGHTYESIMKLVADNQPLPTFPLAASLRVKTTVTESTMEASNVVAMLPGSDTKLKNEYVVFSAHLDHLGIGRPVNGDALYNGAMDNASGVASVLEVARLFTESGVKPKRSVIFLTVTGEEKGELGSRYFAAHPTVPGKQIVADINLDMFLPLYKLKVLEVQGLVESSLGDVVRDAAKEEGVGVQTDREPDQNRFIRSDQYSFIRQGVPALAFKFGYEFGSPEEKIRQDWVKTIYHRPADDLNQPVDLESAAKFDRIIFGLIRRIADDPERPHWKDDSFFRRFAK
jgi:Zn-dependent M28 family amino/carboxypeptidase